MTENTNLCFTILYDNDSPDIANAVCMNLKRLISLVAPEIPEWKINHINAIYLTPIVSASEEEEKEE